MEYLYNPVLPVVRPGWPGNPFNAGQFQYLAAPFSPSWNKLLRWQLGPKPLRAEKKADTWRPQVYEDDSYLDRPDDMVVWLGHATFFIQLNGVRLLIDPVLSDLPFVPRFVFPSYPIERIRNIDYLLLSHDHRDHCDKKTLQEVLRHNRPRKILTALRMREVVGSWVNGTPVEEAAWYQRYDTPEPIEIIFLPARHWCRRGLLDFNRRLWGSFLIRTDRATVYFGADSGYHTHFREIGELVSGIDLAVIGIGAYRPDFIMAEIHTSPAEALQAFLDLDAGRLLPMHYGTYDLSDEPISEPYREIQRLFAEAEMSERLVLPMVGQPVEVRKNEE